MRATEVLQRCLDSALAPMHALRRQTLLLALESLLVGRRVVLIDLARSWVGAERIRAPLKRLDRLLGNPRLHAERERLYGGMVRWLVRSPAPVIVVDWCRLKADGRWHLLRAAVPVGGRTLTLFEQVFPERQLASPKAERGFLLRLKALLPPDSRPILVTDAGFRAPWLLAVSPSLQGMTVPQIVALYRRRMQIELSFRDLKSHRDGHAYEDSLTRKRKRIEVLPLLHALAMFVSWLAGMAAEAIDAQGKLNPYPTSRRLYSLIRLGWEALTRRWLEKCGIAMLDALHRLSPEARQNMEGAA
jgi:hypothetical protein